MHVRRSLTSRPYYNAKCKEADRWARHDRQRLRRFDRSHREGPCDVKLTLINISNGQGVTKKRGGIDDPDRHGSAGLPAGDPRLAAGADLRREDRGHPVVRATVHGAGQPRSPGSGRRQLGDRRDLARPEEAHALKVKGKSRNVGFASSVGRKGKKRTLRVTFVSEDGNKSTAIHEFPK